MNLHKRKIRSVVIVASLALLYYVLYFALLMYLLEGIWKYALGIIPVLISAVMIYVSKERIQEIRSGEEDDLGKY